MKDHSCALILGGYVNGYSIMQELYDNGVTDIVLFSTTREPGSYSNKIKKFVLIDKSPGTLQKELQALSADYSSIVLFPTDDLQLENIHAIADQISDFCFIPFNRSNFSASLDKYTQYTWCDTLGVPRPKTIEIRTVEDIDTISTITFPILLKPKTRQDEKINIFRNLHLHDEHDLRTNTETIKNFVLAGVSFIASEIVPGDGSNIYAYVGYRSREGRILNESDREKIIAVPG